MNERVIYLAGLFDGEGSFSIQVDTRRTKPRKNGVQTETVHIHCNPRMSMTIKYGKEVLQELIEEFGGTVYDYPEQGEHRWFLGKREEQLVAAKALLPYLRIKKHICERYIEALEMFPTDRKDRYNGERSWTPELTNKVAYIALTLNPGSSRKSPKTIEYLEELKKIYGGQDDNHLCV